MYPTHPDAVAQLISRDDIVIAELIALVGVFIWLAALTWFVVSDALRARRRHRDHPRDPNKHFHLHHH